MITQVTGITRIRMLYLQLLYRCNFSCKHCFHGELLKNQTSYSREEAYQLMGYFRETFALEEVTLLGGEPLLFTDIEGVVTDAFDLGLKIDICTNGHRSLARKLPALAGKLQLLRVSIEGLQETNDSIRKEGAFEGALATLRFARELGIPTGVTTTVTSSNIGELAALAEILLALGVKEYKLHCLRLVGNAVRHPNLIVYDGSAYSRLRESLAGFGERGLEIVLDSDLSETPEGEVCSNLLGPAWLDRIEADPQGGLTMSCKAVGTNVNAFRWDRDERSVLYEPTGHDEVAMQIPDVVYERR